MVKTIHFILILFLTLLNISGCSTKKTGTEKPMDEKKMIKGDVINLFWIDTGTDFSQYSSIQLPNFKDEREIEKYEWVQELIADKVADRLSEFKALSIIDRTPTLSVPWTDLTLEGVITLLEVNFEARCQINVECTLTDTRRKEVVCYFKHQNLIFTPNIGSSNPIRKIVEKTATDIALFIKNIDRYQQEMKKK